MAGTVMHLVIADMLLEKLNIKNPALFYCGNLAPDAIMGRDNYQREMKNHTHFKDGLKPYEFRIKNNQEEYFPRLKKFADEFLREDRSDYELFLGYIVHILVDELYLLTYYEDTLLELEKAGISPDDDEFCKNFTGDVDRVDWELVREYKFKHPMPEILLSISDYEIPGWITSQEIERSKSFVVHKNFYTKHEKEPLEVTTFGRNYEYIELCVSRIPNMLKERFGVKMQNANWRNEND